MILPNSEMTRADLLALVTAATAAAAAGKIKHGPFLLFNPENDPSYFDLLPPYIITDRGGWVAGTYNAAEQVDCDGYQFICVSNGTTARPLDATTGNPSGDWFQPWQSCYQRMRDEVHAGLLFWEHGGTVDLFKESVSGPWPCQYPNINYDKLAFYFEDTGNAESVSISGNSGGSYIGKFQIAAGELVWEGSVGVNGGNVFSEPGNVVFNLDGSQASIATTWMDPTAHGTRRIIISYVNDMEWEIVIGGTKPVVLNGSFIISANVIRGVSDTYLPDGTSYTQTVTVDMADPLPLLVIDVSDFIPGAVFTKVLNAHGVLVPDMYDSITATCPIVNQTVNPGTYKVRASSAAIPNFNGTGTLTEAADHTFSGSNTWTHDTYLDIVGMGIGVTQGFTIAVAVDAPGIDDTKQIKKIAVNDFGTAGGFGLQVAQYYGTFNGLETVPTYPTANGPLGPPGWASSVIFYILGYTDPGPGNFPPFSEPVFSRKGYVQILDGISITPTTTGYWLGVTPPVNSLGMMPFDRMPWNQFPTTFPPTTANRATENKYLGYVLPYLGGKSFTNTDAQPAYENYQPAWLPDNATAELQPWPKPWRANTHYPKGFSIIDSYGNIQTVMDPAGRSGATEPVWVPTLGAITNEANYVDLDGGLQPGATWKLTKLLRAGPTILRSRPYTVGTTLIDDNGNTQHCTTAGTTAATAPTWATALTAVTTDGTAVWTLTRVVPKLNPGVARISPPVYPFFWHNPVSQWEPNKDYAAGETISDTAGNIQSSSGGKSGATEPAWGATTSDGTITWGRIRLEQPALTDPNINLSGDHPFSFKPQGWWIYRVFLNRIPQKKSRVKPEGTPISVELGCVRGGVFVSFGTFATGTPVDAMWPIFTNTALAYRCSERVEVAAEILTCGNGYGMWGAVSYPLAAAHINDMMAILLLL